MDTACRVFTGGTAAQMHSIFITEEAMHSFAIGIKKGNMIISS